jgi:aromatic ring-opening dioxygenase LigB subunit
MAQLVFGFGCSHGPLLSTQPERWDLRADDDRKNPEHPFRGGTYTFPELVDVRRGERDFEHEMSLATRQERHARNQRAMDRLGQKLAEVNPDVVIVVGDDQHEWFQEDIQPSFSIYCDDKVINAAMTEEELAKKSPGIRIAKAGQHPPVDHTYPVPQALAHAIIDQAMEDEFDLAISAEQVHKNGKLVSVGHAVGFIYRRILKDRPVPVIPILLNTYFPPNQPTVRRCWNFGKSIGRAIAGWNGENKNKRVAICASGGISHFVVDEDFDTRMIDAMKKGDTKTMFAEPEIMFRSGTSETKNWITVAGIMSESGRKMEMVDYVPSYRSEGGTGCGMGYATWE